MSHRPARPDAGDAAMLSRFGALDKLQDRPMISEALSDMKELLVARRGLVRDRVAAFNRDHVHRAPLLKRLASAKSSARLPRSMLRCAMCRADGELTARLDILVSIPGIGEATAMTMLIEMAELGSIDKKCVASLAGLTPVARDSRQHSGKRFIRGGRALTKPGKKTTLAKMDTLAPTERQQLRRHVPSTEQANDRRFLSTYSNKSNHVSAASALGTLIFDFEAAQQAPASPQLRTPDGRKNFYYPKKRLNY